MAHLAIEHGDGNGRAPGIRVSWQALTVIVTVVGLVSGLVGWIRAGDIQSIEREIAAVDSARKSDKDELGRRLDRIEDGIDAIRAWQLSQGERR